MKPFSRHRATPPEVAKEAAPAPLSPLDAELQLLVLDAQEKRWLGILARTTHCSDVIASELDYIRTQRSHLQPALESTQPPTTV